MLSDVRPQTPYIEKEKPILKNRLRTLLLNKQFGAPTIIMLFIFFLVWAK